MSISKKLLELKLISGPEVCRVFDKIYPDILTLSYRSESKLIENLWSRYTPITPSTNGNVFEGLLATIMYRSGISPIFVQAKISFVPNVDFDFVAYSDEYGPIVISAKTSLRERYKQADLEGMMLRQVHRRAKSYLITLNSTETNSVNEKIKNGQVLGLDDVILATDDKFDDLIKFLKTLNYSQPKKIDIITGKRVII